MNKSLLIWPLYLWLVTTSYAQQRPSTPEVTIQPAGTLHFLSPEIIKYVDIATKQLVGDLPKPELFRLKVRDSITGFKGGTVTIVGETFLAQFKIVPGDARSPTLINIEPSAMAPLDISGVGHSQAQLRQMALDLVAKEPVTPIRSERAFGLDLRLNGVYHVGDHLFLDVSCINATSLPYHIEQLRLKIDDQKQTKATNVQSLEIEPVLRLFDTSFFVKHYRNIIVIKKLSIPGSKVLNLELSEKQVSGRVIGLKVKYSDILAADTLPW